MVKVKFFKGCFSQISLGPFLNTLTQLSTTLHTSLPKLPSNNLPSCLYCDICELLLTAQKFVFIIF